MTSHIHSLHTVDKKLILLKIYEVNEIICLWLVVAETVNKNCLYVLNIHCNAVLAGIPSHLAWHLQSLTNALIVFASSKCDHIKLLLRQLHWLKVPWWIDYKLAALVYKYFMVWHRHTSLTNFIIQQSRSFEGICIPLCPMNCLFPVPDSQLQRPSFSSCCSTDLEQSSTTHHICSVTSRLLLSLENILLSTFLPVITVVVPAK